MYLVNQRNKDRISPVDLNILGVDVHPIDFNGKYSQVCLLDWFFSPSVWGVANWVERAIPPHVKGPKGDGNGQPV